MLTHLQIRDFALIESLELEVHPGLSVLTGETGAGKSIIVEALEMIAGGRAVPEAIRQGAERAEISATFSLAQAAPELRRWLEEQSLGAGEELAIRRVIAADGRSRAYVDGQVVAIQALRELGALLVDIHGQHEFQSLTRGAAQRELLDAFGRLEPLAGEVGSAHRAWLALLNRTLEFESKAHDLEARRALLDHEARELEALAPAEGEHQSLAEERTRLAAGERLAESAQLALASLFESDEASAHAGASRALTALRGASALDPGIAPITPLIESAVIQIREAARELQHYLERLETDVARQDHVERRLAALEEVARKHRVNPDELPARARQIAADLATLESAASGLGTLRADLGAALDRYRELAGELSARRAAAGRALAAEVTARMQSLGMAGGRFEVEVAPLESSEPAPHGVDRIEFRVAANPGQPARALAKVASGGELSRLSLAVEVCCAAHAVGCMIFDEVDAGIGGAVAEIVGRELRALASSGAQVLCVTHLPQVASQGHRHLRVEKVAGARTARTTLRELGAEDRVEEIARMLGGIEVTAKAREHALEMLRGTGTGTGTAPSPAPATGTANQPLRPASSGKRSSAARNARRG